MSPNCNTISVRLSNQEINRLNKLAITHGSRTAAIKALINHQPQEIDVIGRLDLSEAQQEIIKEVSTKIGCNTYYVIRRFMAAGINQYLIEAKSVISDGMHTSNSGGGGQ